LLGPSLWQKTIWCPSPHSIDHQALHDINAPFVFISTHMSQTDLVS
jgi:hypothetical protein